LRIYSSESDELFDRPVHCRVNRTRASSRPTPRTTMASTAQQTSLNRIFSRLATPFGNAAAPSGVPASRLDHQGPNTHRGRRIGVRRRDPAHVAGVAQILGRRGPISGPRRRNGARRPGSLLGTDSRRSHPLDTSRDRRANKVVLKEAHRLRAFDRLVPDSAVAWRFDAGRAESDFIPQA
jgi:hypothetical protein